MASPMIDRHRSSSYRNFCDETHLHDQTRLSNNPLDRFPMLRGLHDTRTSPLVCTYQQDTTCGRESTQVEWIEHLHEEGIRGASLGGLLRLCQPRGNTRMVHGIMPSLRILQIAPQSSSFLGIESDRPPVLTQFGVTTDIARANLGLQSLGSCSIWRSRP